MIRLCRLGESRRHAFHYEVRLSRRRWHPPSLRQNVVPASRRRLFVPYVNSIMNEQIVRVKVSNRSGYVGRCLIDTPLSERCTAQEFRPCASLFGETLNIAVLSCRRAIKNRRRGRRFFDHVSRLCRERDEQRSGLLLRGALRAPWLLVTLARV